MPSRSLDRWNNERMSKLDEMEHAHKSVSGAGRGRRYATQQINQSYVVMLSSQFQAYCRDLHTECVAMLALEAGPPTLQSMFRIAMMRDRKLDHGNPNPGNIGADYGRFDIGFWHEVQRLEARCARLMRSLDQLTIWRNAVAHQDFSSAGLGGRNTVRLRHVHSWRASLVRLATTFDEVMYNYLTATTGRRPW